MSFFFFSNFFFFFKFFFSNSFFQILFLKFFLSNSFYQKKISMFFFPFISDGSRNERNYRDIAVGWEGGGGVDCRWLCRGAGGKRWLPHISSNNFRFCWRMKRSTRQAGQGRPAAGCGVGVVGTPPPKQAATPPLLHRVDWLDHGS